MPDYVILGGGVAGLYAALRAVRKGAEVCVVEQASEPGGLMRSRGFVDNGSFHTFDYGTHYLLLTGVKEIDADLMRAVDENNWRWFDDSLPEANYYGGQLDLDTGCLNLTGHARHREFLDDFTSAPGAGDAEPTLADAVLTDFGKSILSDVFDPVCRKFTGLAPEEVALEAFKVFANYRMKLVTDAETAKDMKREPLIDQRLAHPKRITGSSAIRKGYPSDGGGIGLFMQGLADYLKAEGVEILTSTTVSDAVHTENGISQLTLDQGGEKKIVGCGKLVSTLAPALTARIFGIEFPSAPHRTRNLCLHHFVFDQAPLLDVPHWITVFEPEMRSYRVTMYNNIAGRHDGPHRITVETITDQMETEEGLGSRLLVELRQMGIVASGVEPMVSFTDIYPRAIPVFLPGWKESVAKQAEAVCSSIGNLIPVGLASGTRFGQIAALKSAYEAIG